MGIHTAHVGACGLDSPLSPAPHGRGSTTLPPFLSSWNLEYRVDPVWSDYRYSHNSTSGW